MPFIEDENGLAFYFSHEQWNMIVESLEWEYYPPCSEPESGCGCCEAGKIIKEIRKRVKNV